MTLVFYNQKRDAKVLVLPHELDARMVNLELYKSKKVIFIKYWAFIKRVDGTWQENRKAMINYINDIFPEMNIAHE